MSEGKFLAALFIAMIALVVWCAHEIDKGDMKKCAELMHMARSSSDSIAARVGCEQIRAASSEAISIGVMAGAASAAAASRSR